MQNIISNKDWADVLIQALPYIQKYTGKTVVVKYGGNAMLNDDLKQAVMEDLVLMTLVGIKTVLVHGGGPEINAGLDKIGKEPKFIDGLRYTDEETMEVVVEVLAGKLNKEIVSVLQKAGGKAVGLCGIDGGMLRARRLIKNNVDLGFVGEVTKVDSGVIRHLLAEDYIPVISTVAVGEGDDTHAYNINADTAAAQIAIDLGAEKFIQITNVPGILRNMADPDSLIPVLSRPEIPPLQRDGVISGGMIPKVECCVLALEGGVRRTHIIDGRVAHSLLIEVFSDKALGTMIL
jgi:acetylglutamate kinase